MHFHSMKAFLDMGGHAFYVWTAYGLAFVILAGNGLWTIVKSRIGMRAIRKFIRVNS